MNDSIVKSKRIRGRRPFTGYLCLQCKGAKSGQADMCLQCSLDMERPPIDNTIYIDSAKPYRKVRLTKKQYSLVDADQFHKAEGILWRAQWDETTRGFYAVTSFLIDGKQVKMSLHELLVNAPSGKLADHINGNFTLDNRSNNLRVADYSQSSCNRRRRKDNWSGETNVYWRAARSRWIVDIKVRGINHRIGSFKEFDAAKVARDEAVVRLHGEFARVG